MPLVDGGQTPIASGGWGISPQTPAAPPPHCGFLATRQHKEEFTAHFCRPPFVLAFGFKRVWNVWQRRQEDVLIHKRCMIRPKVFHPVILKQKNYLKKSSYLHQPHFGFGRDEFFFS